MSESTRVDHMAVDLERTSGFDPTMPPQGRPDPPERSGLYLMLEARLAEGCPRATEGRVMLRALGKAEETADHIAGAAERFLNAVGLPEAADDLIDWTEEDDWRQMLW